MTTLDNNTFPEAVAIVGMDCRFPGANNISKFWQNLCNGVESIHFFDDSELDHSISPDLIKSQNYIKARGSISDIDMFDASFFGISPREAEIMDPQHRLFLELAWTALEDAAYDPEIFKGLIGVYAGMGNNTYFSKHVSAHPERINMFGEFQSTLANEKDYLTTRVSYKLNLKGPSVNINTACSTSLVAVCHAFESLLSYQCDIALAGGITIVCPQNSGCLYHPESIFSPDGHCRPFDSLSQGTIAGNGGGIIVLKRLEAALNDGDNIYAVIRGTALNNDGSAGKMSFMSPSVDGQAEVIAMAQANAQVDPETISYIETHGTATALGDPIEIAALTQAFRTTTDKNNFCAIGSVKSNIGHLDSASGIAGLIKTALALKNKQIPPTLHFKKPNPKIDFENSPFYVMDHLADWQTIDTFPRRAGVSSFGVGGTNAHIVLEEPPEKKAMATQKSMHLLLLDAKTETALEKVSANLFSHIRKNREISIADAAYTLQAGCHNFKWRRSVLVGNIEDAVNTFKSLPLSRVNTTVCGRLEPQPVFMFTGQGSQHINMARELYYNEPLFRENTDKCIDILKPLIGFDLSELMYPNQEKNKEATQKLNQTEIAQPALFVLEYSLARLLMEWGIYPSAMIGHSIGEYLAACIAGVFSLKEALELVSTRGKLMQSQPRGAMVAISLSEKELQKYMNNELCIAVVNGPSRCVVSGPAHAIKTLTDKFSKTTNDKGQNIGFSLLHTSHAFHSNMMDNAIKPFLDIAAKISFHPPQIPFISNITGTWITDKQATDPEYWGSHIRQPVLFSQGIDTLLKKSDSIFLEVGPGNTLASLARLHQSKTKNFSAINSLPHPQQQSSDYVFFLNFIGKLWTSGVSIEWSKIYKREKRLRISLPTYPFERQSFWLESLAFSVNTEIKNRSEKIKDRIETKLSGLSANIDKQSPNRKNTGHYNKLEEKIKDIWEKHLGISPIQLNDSFFDIGGDSLIALQIIPELEKIFGKSLPLSTLFEATTIEKLSKLFRQKDWSPSWSPIVPIKAAGSKPPFFCIHGAGGNVLLYMGLAKRLCTDQPFYGIQCVGMDRKESFLANIEEMASNYINEIKRHQAKGPYYLGGYCMGGQIAFEMARQLNQQGQKVVFLALFDSHSNYEEEKKIYYKLYRLVQNITFHIRNIVIINGIKGRYSFIKERALEAKRRIFLRFHIIFHKISHKLGLGDEPSMLIMEKINDQACWNYIVKPYPGKVTVFKPRSAYLGYEDPTLGWGKVCAEVEVQQLPVFPAGMLVEPFNDILAERFSACLEKAQNNN